MLRLKASHLAAMQQPKRVYVDGRAYPVTDLLSSGPGTPIHTYMLSGGAYVYEIAGLWWLQERGQFKRPVEVSFEV